MKITVKNLTENKIIFDKNEMDIISISFNVVNDDEEISCVIGCNEDVFFRTYRKVINSENNSVSLSYKEIKIIYSSIHYCYSAIGLDRVKKILNRKIPDNCLWEYLITELNNLLKQA